jgi:hypothetical protein
MSDDLERNLGIQPIAPLMARHKLTPHDLVANSSEQLTHKMVARAMKGRRLTVHVQSKVLHALNQACGRNYSREELFNY